MKIEAGFDSKHSLSPRGARAVMEAAHALLADVADGADVADANAAPTQAAMDEELKFLLLRERKYAGLLKYRWPDDTRAAFASILLEVYVKHDWLYMHDVLWSSIVKAMALADLYYCGEGSDAGRAKGEGENAGDGEDEGDG